ncbi:MULTISPECIES: NF038215 family lipoprotein [unclassified Acinetobacter]|uniref:NF038215 family lipoprotein n=1 Tax=unclassified Acinetobacter TaxID=196816 RepID=UPI00135B64BF|nr:MULTISPECIES: NF038215 family lipoprotein [unclassified Acinetobacter]HJE54503.1 NF038215 family lipoprotein [Acinetobacter pseudolwoffii]
MKILSYAVLVGVMLSLSGCDDAMNKPKTETRTMIIGGVPVHDQDYQLLGTQFIAQDQLKQ